MSRWHRTIGTTNCCNRGIGIFPVEIYRNEKEEEEKKLIEEQKEKVPRKCILVKKCAK